MSSAILYLAIIAIWACVLVPRLIHKPHRSASAVPPSSAQPAAAMASAAVAGTVPGSAPGPAGLDEDADFEAGPEPGEGAEGTVPPAAPSPGLLAAPVQLSADADLDAAETRDTGEYGQAAEQAVAWHRYQQRASYHTVSAGSERPALTRARVLQARRRLLTMLTALMIASLTCTVTGLSPGWVLIPAGGMLGMYLLLLREAANADAERAQWLAGERAAARAEAFRQIRAGQAWEASQAQPVAEIIDISDRVGDQLYDQYTDAEVRAVGD